MRPDPAGANSGPAALYRQLVRSGKLEPDPGQVTVSAALEDRYQALIRRRRRWWRRPEPVAGLYIHGSVGRGKTLLMDLFAASLRDAGVAVTRMHFNRFMDAVHGRLQRLDRRRDPLTDIAREFAGKGRVLCFDEFHVDDIGDAMILGRLLSALFARATTLVVTSNTAPDDLYADGLQRARLVPAIERIKAHCRTLEIDAGEDFRLRELTRHPVYYTPLDAAAEEAVEQEFKAMSPGESLSREPLEVRGRRLTIRRRAGSVVWFDFDQLCRGPRASADYIDLACRFSTLLISGVAQLGDADNDAARRFVHLIDECYDRAVKLIISAAVPAEALYTGERLAAEFERTRSRLIEMQSHEYLAQPHRP